MFFPSGNRGLCLLLTLVILGSLAGFSQPYVFNGNASSVGGGCWQITPPTTGQRGSIWSTSQINLNQPFDITWDLLFGNNNGGANGIVFVLQNTGTNVLGGTGGSLSFAGISPSLGWSLTPGKMPLILHRTTLGFNGTVPPHIPRLI